MHYFVKCITSSIQYATLFNGAKPARQAFVYNIVNNPVPVPEKNATVMHATGAVRYGRWKILNFGDDAKPLMPLGTFHLYDLKIDPEEKNDLFDKEPEVSKRMVEIFEVG